MTDIVNQFIELYSSGESDESKSQQFQQIIQRLQSSYDNLYVIDSLKQISFDKLAPALDSHSLTNLKIETYIELSKLLISIDDTSNSEAYLSNASNLLPLLNTDTDTKIDKYKLNLKIGLEELYSDILFLNGKFIEASAKRLTLINNLSDDLVDNMWLKQSNDIMIKYLLVAPPDFRKQKLMKNLSKDSKIYASLSPLTKTIFLKNYHRRLITQSEMDEFLKSIPILQKFTETSPIYRKLIENLTEHNLLSLSLVYSNISFKTLQEHTNLTPDSLENIVSKMIVEKKLYGLIDQVEQVLYFNESNDNSFDDDEEKEDALTLWGQFIDEFCKNVEYVSNLIEVEGR